MRGLDNEFGICSIPDLKTIENMFPSVLEEITKNKYSKFLVCRMSGSEANDLRLPIPQVIFHPVSPTFPTPSIIVIKTYVENLLKRSMCNEYENNVNVIT